jgi:FAD synthase
MVITDPKGELFQLHSKYLRSRGYDVKVIDLRDTYSSYRWNPLDSIWENHELYRNAHTLAFKRTDDITKSGLKIEKAAGDVTLLAKSFRLKTVDLLYREEKKIASRDIKKMISDGLVEVAQEELGRPYCLKGVVHEGFHNGRTIGFPTLNLHLDEPYILPKGGVYLTETEVNGKRYKSITNIGTNPTVGLLHHERVESYLKGFEGNAYEERISVYFLKRIRDEKKFSSLDELRAQLEKDKALLD